MAAVLVDDLVVRYGTHTAVDGASFTAEAGAVTAVIGPNGAGKTSTIEVCEGYRQAASGTVRVLGLDPSREQRRLGERMGVMLQEGGVYPSARVGEVVAQYSALYDRGADPRALVDLVGLADRSRTAWRRLSGGEKQRLSLALALAARPEVAFLDEPTSGVDVGGRATIRQIVRDLAAGGCAVVLATHELDEAERVADHVVMFHRGRVVADGTVASVRGTAHEVRFRTASPIDAHAAATALGRPVAPAASGDVPEYVVAGDSAVIPSLEAWLAATGAQLIEVRAGAARLEDVFLRLTGQSA